LVHPLHKHEIEKRGCKYYKNKFRGTPCIKQHTAKKYDNILICVACQKINGQEYRKEVQQKSDAAKNQAAIITRKRLELLK
jgi:hypothetical protein